MDETQVGALINVDRKRASDPSRSYGLPDELLEQAIRRLSVMSSLVAAFFALSLTANTIGYFIGYAPLPPIAVGARVVGLLAAVVVFLVTRHGAIDRQLRCDLGLGFEVVGAASISVTEFTATAAMGLPNGILATVSVWTLLFRLLVPAAPRKALLTCFASAATVPVAIWLRQSAGYPPVEFRSMISIFVSTTVVATVAWVASKSIYRMGTALNEARQIGTYRLEKRLGVGGMGEVWCASHRMLKRPAAIKLIRPEHLGADSATALKRFEREAQATAMLHSTHTVQIFDFGATSDGSFFYVMELLDGLDLETLVERYGPLPPERAIYFLQQICHSLADAHDNNMIHRDVKPANIFACRLGPDDDFIKVLDFGLAKQADGAPTTEVRLTSENTTTGTPAYMAPEMALGDPPVGPQTDLYMLGCVAYWLLTSELVFESNSAVGMVAKHVGEAPVPVSQRTELDLPEGLEDIVMSCLQKDVERRPASARAVWERLDDLQIEARWNQPRAQRWWESHRPSG